MQFINRIVYLNESDDFTAKISNDLVNVTIEKIQQSLLQINTGSLSPTFYFDGEAQPLGQPAKINISFDPTGDTDIDMRIRNALKINNI